MTQRRDAVELLRRAVHDPHAEFRSGQWEAIDAIVNQRGRLLVVQRTGWGKSSVYFIATRILRDRGAGPTLIVSPLLALMRNQLEAAARLGIKAITINSTNTDDWLALTQSILSGEVDALLISPERLANDEFVENVLLRIANRVGLLVVDEAHCISDWGHDFRPDYRRLVNVLQRMPENLPVLGTTATANNRVIEDIRRQLGEIVIQRGSLIRESLALQTLRLPDQAARLAWLAERLPALPGTGIVYVLTKRDAEQVAQWLRQKGVEAHAYYSDVLNPAFPDSDAYRQHLESQLYGNRIKALIATTALGMGYDKPDLGFVVHYQAPGSIVHYYQQVGRAGRAIDHAVGVLLSGSEDQEIQEYFRASAFPDEAHVNTILQSLSDSDGLTERQIELHVNLRAGQITKALKYLSVDNPAPVLKDRSVWRRTPIEYRMDHNNIQRLTQQRTMEWAEVQEYVDTKECLMQYLARKLDDPYPTPCGKCARCLNRPVTPDAYPHSLGVDAALFLRHSEFPLECKVQVARDAFPKYGFEKTLSKELRAMLGRVLSRWGDAGWGQLVKDDKHAGHFRDELVAAAAEMVQERWKPEPAPAWLTCVPSRNHANLVPDFARRLGDRLGLPFVPAVIKVLENEPQKLQENRYYQCRNLDGAFEIASLIPDGPVLLVDDMVDSAWTMTVVAALLRQAGSGPVFPLALAQSSAGD